MSIHVSEFVWKLAGLKPSEKLIMLKLADHADDNNWRCWPSLQRIEGDTGLSRSSVARILKKLDSDEWINRERGGIKRTTRYTLNKKKIRQSAPALVSHSDYPNPSSDSGSPTVTQRVVPSSDSGSPTVIPKPSIQPSKEPSIQTPPPPVAALDDFPEFWSSYPRKVGKQDALEAFTQQLKAGVLPSIEKLKTAIKRANASPTWQKDEGQYIPYPKTWLNRHGWDVEIGPPSVLDLKSTMPSGPPAAPDGWERWVESQGFLRPPSDWVELSRNLQERCFKWLNEEVPA